MSNLHKYQDVPYPIKNITGRKLRIGDKVFIHPSTTSITRKKYEATIVLKLWNWGSGSKKELSTHVDGGHIALINDYLFSRMEYKLSKEEIIKNRNEKIDHIIHG